MNFNTNFYNKKRRPYYILAPNYTRLSAGIRVLHLLCHYLNKLGEEAYVFTEQTDNSLRTPILTQEIVDRHKATNRSPIAIYPEVVHGNPFQAASVVRYILNHPGLLGGPKNFDPQDMQIFWSAEYVDLAKTPNPSYVMIPNIDMDVFNNENNPHDRDRQQVLIYPGRYVQAEKDFPELFKDASVITYKWPQSHEELAALLRKGKVLYCFANSAILSEALLCGCPVVLKDSPFTRRPDSPGGDNIALEVPGVIQDDSPEALEQAWRLTKEYTKIHLQLLQDLFLQLQAFVDASQRLAVPEHEEIILPLFGKPNPPAEQSPVQASYMTWREQHKLKPQHAQLHAENMVKHWPSQPRFIILMPLTEEKLPAALKTVSCMATQLYKQWQLVFVADFDEPSTAFSNSDVLGWLRIDDASDHAQLTQAYAAVLNALPCDWITILPAGSEIEPNSMLVLGDYAALHPEWHAMYSDSDTLTETGEYAAPAFKPDLNPDLLRGYDYIGPASWFRREALLGANGWSDVPGADHYDAIWRIHDYYGAASIGHIPLPLVHLPALSTVGEGDHDPKSSALAAHFRRQHIEADIGTGCSVEIRTIDYPVNAFPQVSIVVISNDDPLYLSGCLEALLSNTDYPCYEILAVTAMEGLPAAVRTVQCDSHEQSVRMQLGARAARGDYLLFLDSRVEVIQADWLRRLMGIAQRQEVGATAPRLLASDGKTLSRSPFVLGMDGCAAPGWEHEEVAAAGHLHRQQVAHNPGALALDCFLIKQSLYSVLPMDDEVPLGGDAAAIDLSMKIRAAGRLLVWTPSVSAVRHSGTQQTATLSQQDRTQLLQRWKGRIAQDPAYHRQLCLDSRRAFMIDTELAPSWDGSLHDRPRLLLLSPDSESGHLSLHTAICQLEEAAQCQAMWLDAGQRLPTMTELMRLAPDTLVLPMRLDPAYLAWQQQLRQLLPDLLSVLVINGLPSDWQASPFNQSLLQALLAQADRIIVPTSNLQAQLSACSRDVRLVPEAVNDAVWSKLSASRRAGRKLRIGWTYCAKDDVDHALLEQIIARTKDSVVWVGLGNCPEDLHPSLAECYAVDYESETYPSTLASLALDLAFIPHDGGTSFGQMLAYGMLGIAVMSAPQTHLQTLNTPMMVLDGGIDDWVNAILQFNDKKQDVWLAGDKLKSWVQTNHLLSQRLALWMECLVSS